MTDLAPNANTAPLFQSERLREIANLTRRAQRVEVAELAERFNVTTETIRRDLSELQAQKVVRRVHGGAVPWESVGFEPLLSVRDDLQDAEKRRLAERAVLELPDTGSIIIDSGSTLYRFAEAIPAACDLHAVTNSLAIAQLLAAHETIEATVVGGKVRKNTMAMVDATAIAAIEPLSVDTLFISSDGASIEQGLTTPYSEESHLKQAMIRAARRVVALIDHTKVGTDHFTRFATWSDIDLLVTTEEVDSDFVRGVEALGTSVELA